MLFRKSVNSIYYLLIFIIIALGFYWRIKLYSFGFFPRTDEINLHFNLINLSFLDYFHSLEGCQIAPPFYMMLNKLITLIFGHGIFAIHFFSVFCGCLSVFMFFMLLQKSFTSKLPVIIGMFLFSASIPLIFFSADFKPYISDVLITIILLFIYDKINFETNKNFLCTALVFFFVPFFSFTSLFTFGAIILSKGFDFYKDTDKKTKYLKLFALTVLLFISALIIYFINREVFVGINAGWNLGYINSFQSLVEVIKQFLDYMHLQFLVSLFLVIGTLLAFLKNKKYPRLCAIIILLQIIAACINVYPFLERASLYIIPAILLLLVSAGDFKADKWFVIKTIIFLYVIFASIDPINLKKDLSDLSNIDDYQSRKLKWEESIAFLNMYQNGQKVICYDDYWIITLYYNKLNNYNHSFNHVAAFIEPLKGFDVIEKELTENKNDSYWVFGIYNSFLNDFIPVSKEDVKELIEKTGRPYKVYPTNNGDIYFLEKQETKE